MTSAEILKEANQALRDKKLSWADYQALITSLLFHPKNVDTATVRTAKTKTSAK